MQTLINEKNQQIQELMNNQKYMQTLQENFKYIRTLNKDYLNVDIGNGKTAYTELEKVELERKYLEYVDQGVKKADKCI